MEKPNIDRSELSDEELDRLYDQILSKNDDELDEEVIRARAALNMIARVREQTETETTRQVDTFFDRLAGKTLESSSIPKSIGRFQIKRILGQGGFGLVFLAHDPNLNRDIALKIPRSGTITTPELKSRFVHEGRAAASLAHPNIVPVFESGQLDNICYLASKFIDGEPLDDWLDFQQSIAPRTAAQICWAIADGLSHAHQRGVLHRDIKPANILVSKSLKNAPSIRDSIASQIQITDFGLAKSLGEDSSQTQTGALIGTPSFMSPEQAEQKPAIESSDVYSAGAVLYFLLTKKPPISGANIIDTIKRVIHDEPVSPRKINPSVAADLEAICLKSLEKNPESRYQSAIELRQDLERYLDGDPVLARRITWPTRTARWLNRNRLATALIVALFAGAIGTSAGLVREMAATKKAVAAEAIARIEAKTAEKTSDFLVDLFNIPDSKRNGKENLRGSDVTAEMILQQGATKAHATLQDEPEVLARMLVTIGKANSNLAIYDEAEKNLRDAIELQYEALSPHDPELAETHLALGNLLRHMDQSDDATEEVDIAIKILSRDIDRNHMALARAYNQIGLLLKRSNPDRALAAYLEARALVTSFAGEDQAGLWQIDSNIAGIHYGAGRYANAKTAYVEVLKGGIAVHGPDHPRIGTIYNNMARVELKLGDFLAAKELQEKDLALLDKHMKPNHPNYISTYSGLSNSCRKLCDYESAKLYGAKAVAVAEASLPKPHSYRWIMLNNYSLTLLRSGDFDEARRQIERALVALDDRTDDSAEKNRLSSLILLARTERLAGNPEIALEIIERVLGNPIVDSNGALKGDAMLMHAHILAELNHEDAIAALTATTEYIRDSPIRPQDQAHGLARYWAIQGDVDQAFNKLNEAIELGYRDGYVLTDPDFESLREDPRFQQINSTIRPHLGLAP